MAKQSSQKFIARNRAPRVQIEYDVEVYGSEKKVQLPFVMGVMSDLSGKPEKPLPPVADRKFLEIDIDNFDQRLKAMMPRVAFAVPNTLDGRRQPASRSDVREHGRFFAGRDREESRAAAKAARDANAVVELDDLYGWQVRRRRPRWKNAPRPSIVANLGLDAKPGGRRQER